MLRNLSNILTAFYLGEVFNLLSPNCQDLKWNSTDLLSLPPKFFSTQYRCSLLCFEYEGEMYSNVFLEHYTTKFVVHYTQRNTNTHAYTHRKTLSLGLL